MFAKHTPARRSPSGPDAAAPAWAWPAALVLAVVAGTLATACMTPFVAVGALAAATLPRGRAAATVGGVWLLNQALGFGVLHYPLTPDAFGWGAAMGAAALAACGAAGLLARPGRVSALRLALAFALGFAAYEGLLFGYALFAGGTATFTPAIVGRIALNDGGWLVALSAVRLLLGWRAPRWFGPAPALRLA